MSKMPTLNLLIVVLLSLYLPSHVFAQPPGYEAQCFKWDSVGEDWIDLGWGDTLAPARCFVTTHPQWDSCGDTIQWIKWSIAGTQWEWFVREPGIYAANAITFIVASDSDVVIDYEGIEALQTEITGVDSTLQIWYGIAEAWPEPPPPDDTAWVIAEDLNSDDDTLYDSEELELGIQFKKWNLVEVNESNLFWPYSDSATVHFRTYGTCNESYPFSVVVHHKPWGCADFVGSPTSGSYPLEVRFTDLSTCDVRSWFWDFGDNWTSGEQHPTHTYNDTEQFDVMLIISCGENGEHMDTMIKPAYIHVLPPIDFTIEIEPDTQEVEAGYSVDFDVILTSLYGFACPCTLTISGLPPDASGSFDPNPVVPTDTSSLQINTTVSTPPDTYTVTVTASEMDKGIAHTAELILIIIPPPDFTIEVEPDIQKVLAGNSVDYDVILTSLYGFASSCTLTMIGLPPDASGSFDSNPVTPTDTSLLTVYTAETTTPGAYDLTITATELPRAQIQHSTYVVLMVALPETIRIAGYSPVDLIVTDPVGDSISVDSSTIQDAIYDTTMDVNEDGDKDDVVTIPQPLAGEYQIRVIREAEVVREDTTYTLGITIDGNVETLLADNAPVPPPGGSDTFSYECLTYLRGDANGDNETNIADGIFLINYLFISGLAPDPVELGDANCDGKVDIADVVYLVNYLFIGGPSPCS